MTDQAEAVEAAGAGRVRVDWRTGQAMVQHDDAFWRDHEQRRLEQGLSVPQYCAANALALSTYRHRVNGKKRVSARPVATTPAPSGSPSFVPLTAARAELGAVVEIALKGMTLRLDAHHGKTLENGATCTRNLPTSKIENPNARQFVGYLVQPARNTRADPNYFAAQKSEQALDMNGRR